MKREWGIFKRAFLIWSRNYVREQRKAMLRPACMACEAELSIWRQSSTNVISEVNLAFKSEAPKAVIKKASNLRKWKERWNGGHSFSSANRALLWREQYVLANHATEGAWGQWWYVRRLPLKCVKQAGIVICAALMAILNKDRHRE